MTSRQHPSRFLFVAGTLVVLALLVAACGGSHGANTGDGGQHDGPANCTQPDLSIIPPQSYTLSAQATAELKVRYACNSQPYSGMLVSYEIVGDGKGSALSAASVQTDADGVATATLTAGTQSATFEVRASAAGASPLTFSITVNTANVGTIVVTMHYSGTVVFTEYKAYLFQNKQCTAIDAFSITGALQEAAPVAVISAKPQFINVPVGSNYTVAITAKKGADILGFGCTPSINVAAAAKTDVDVTIEDIPVSFNGTYDLDNHFDLTGLLPPSVGNIIHIFDEMSDDHAINGNVALDQWGEDPAAFLLDFIYKQFCRWECTNANPSWSNCTPGTHAMGDLKETYRGMRGVTPFYQWDGDQPAVNSLCGILDEHWGLTQIVQGQVQAIIPDALINITDTIGDLARAIDKMHISSVLTLNDIRPGRQGNFSHELVTMFVNLHDLSGTLHTVQVDLASAGLTNLSYSGNTTVTNDKLQIPSHTFQLKFGKLVQYIYLNFLIPLLAPNCGAPNNTTACLLQQFINCTTVGGWLYDQCVTVMYDWLGLSNTCPVSATTLAGYCTTGLGFAGAYIDNSMASWIGGDTDFTLQGACSASSVDTHRVATALDGTPPTADEAWAGHWVEGTANANFTGYFTGVRQ
ncbi:MAG: hypothetical protein HY906_17410 [Deltaproteobacteria bacterium]|nr:hypothetical protein [Deltaproteobacteria bacterium]